MKGFCKRYSASLFYWLAGACGLGLLDAAVTAVRADGPDFGVIVHVFALTGSLGILAAPMLALATTATVKDPSDMTGMPLRILRTIYPPEAAQRICLTLKMISALILMSVFVAVVTLAALHFFQSMRTEGFAALATAGVALGSALLLVSLQIRLGGACARASTLPGGRMAGILLSPPGLTLALVLATAPFLKKFDDRIVDIVHALPLAEPLAAAFMLAVAGGTAIAIRYDRTSRAFRMAVFGGIPALAVSSMLIALPGIGIGHDVKRAMTTDGMVSPHAFTLARKVLDFDGDGHMNVLGDGDCAPWDPNIGPGLAERPNNGRDEDCDGEDLIFSEENDSFFGKWDFDVPAAIRSKKYNIFLITIDAAAPARMSLYGYERPTTPFLEKFAKESAWFRSAWAAGPSTRLAIPEMMTSSYGPQVDRAVGYRVPLEIRQGNTTMAEVLKRAGFRTFAILPTAYFSNWKGMTQGFESVDKSAVPFDRRDRQNHSGDKVTEAFIASMNKAAADKLRPVFMWAHYYDPHSPYTRVKSGASFGDTKPDLYDAELAFVDGQIEKAVAEIDRLFDPKKTIIIISADHGEAFDANHTTRHHGHDLHSTILHIPLLVRTPFSKPSVFDGPVSALDLLPTILNIENIKGRHKLVGTSLVPQLIDGTDDLNRTIYSLFYLPENVYHEKNPNRMIGVRTKDFNWFKDLDTSVELLYRYRDDPFEETNLIDDMPFTGRELRRSGAKFMLWLARNSEPAARPTDRRAPKKPPAPAPAKDSRKEEKAEDTETGTIPHPLSTRPPRAGAMVNP